MSGPLTEELLDTVVALCRRAGEEILRIYRDPESLQVSRKEDDSPLTAADLAAHKVLTAGLEGLLPGVPLLSEEGCVPPWETRRQWQRYWIIDPLDGTKEFINRNGEFTVNVALVENGEAVLGVVYVPVQQICYAGYRGASGAAAWKYAGGERRAIATRALGAVMSGDEAFVLVASRRHGADAVVDLQESLRQRFGELQTRNMGSSLKLCLVAEGCADLYPRLAPTSEWDTAAAQAIVEAAGGQVLTDELRPMRYNTREEILNPWFYVVGDKHFDWAPLLSPGNR